MGDDEALARRSAAGRDAHRAAAAQPIEWPTLPPPAVHRPGTSPGSGRSGPFHTRTSLARTPVRAGQRLRRPAAVALR